MLSQEDGAIAGLNLAGIKIAYVVSNEDPKAQERVLVRVLGVHNMENTSTDNAVWANHCSPFRSSAGDLPEVGDFIYVVFPNRTDPMSIVWLGFARSSFQDGEEGTDSSVQPIHKEVVNSRLAKKIQNFLGKIF